MQGLLRARLVTGKARSAAGLKPVAVLLGFAPDQFRESSPVPPQVTRRQFGGSAAALAAFMALSQSARATVFLADPPCRWPGLERLLRDYVDTGKVANMVIGPGISYSNTDFMALGNTSFTSGMPATHHTLYRIYSMTKPITGMAVM